MSESTIGIIGYGFVGKAAGELKSVAKLHIYDPHIPEFSSDTHKYNAYTSDIVIACVPTPQHVNGSVDLSILDLALAEYNIVGQKGIFAIKSTIPCGTTDKYCHQYQTSKIIHLPEFLTERTYLQDFHNPTDVIIGGDKVHCDVVAAVLHKFYEGKDIKINICSAKEAELVKTIRNSFYATKIAFMNEIFLLAEQLQVNYDTLEQLITNSGFHPWWGPQHTKVPGPDGLPGYGGKCLPKDAIGLHRLAQSLGIELSILHAAIHSNKRVRP